MNKGQAISMKNSKWQYKTMKFDNMKWFTQDMVDDRFEAKLNSEGEFGWEVAGIFVTTALEGYDKSVIVILKRPAE
jgi:Domain of unknown function (DUF4177)